VGGGRRRPPGEGLASTVFGVAPCGRMDKNMTDKPYRARAIGMVIGIIVLLIALLWKRILR
jgi:hypothetical protein